MVWEHRRPDLVLVTGTAHPGLAAHLAQQLGVDLGACGVERFPDGEVSVRIETPVRRRAVVLLQPTGPPVDAHLVELLAFVDALRRAGAGRITAVIPYFGYARSDKRQGRAEPIGAAMVADLLEAVGVHEVITVDLHAAQIEGFFRIPVESLTAVSALLPAVRRMIGPDTVVVSADAGRVRMATKFAEALGRPLVVIHKRRRSGSDTEVACVAGDVRDRPCLIVDDMIATGETVAEDARGLREAGARGEIVVAATHGLFLPGAGARMAAAGVAAVVVTDTLAVPHADVPGLEVISIAPLVAAAILQMVVAKMPADAAATWV